MVVIREDFPHLLSISEKGFGKRTAFDEYRVQGRGGSGLINFKLSEKTGLVSGIIAARPVDDLMVITSSGIIIRTPVEQISIVGRSTQGVKIINIGDGDSVASIARVDEPTDEDRLEKRQTEVGKPPTQTEATRRRAPRGATLQARLSVLNRRGWILHPR